MISVLICSSDLPRRWADDTMAGRKQDGSTAVQVLIITVWQIKSSLMRQINALSLKINICFGFSDWRIGITKTVQLNSRILGE